MNSNQPLLPPQPKKWDAPWISSHLFQVSPSLSPLNRKQKKRQKKNTNPDSKNKGKLKSLRGDLEIQQKKQKPC